jgi:hypothetical protein
MQVSNCHENHIFPAHGGELVDLILGSLLGLIGNATPYLLPSRGNRPAQPNIKSKLPWLLLASSSACHLLKVRVKGWGVFFSFDYAFSAA